MRRVAKPHHLKVLAAEREVGVAAAGGDAVAVVARAGGADVRADQLRVGGIGDVPDHQSLVGPGPVGGRAHERHGVEAQHAPLDALDDRHGAGDVEHVQPVAVRGDHAGRADHVEPHDPGPRRADGDAADLERRREVRHVDHAEGRIE